MKIVLEQFKLIGKPLSCEPYGNGHINTTFLVKTDKSNDYILQRINKNVFKKPNAVMQNIAAVTDFLLTHSHDPHSVLHLVRTIDDKISYVDEDNETWRVYDFVSDTLTLEQAEFPVDFYESGKAFGRFQNALTKFDATVLAETIPRFHDTPNRYSQLKEAIKNDASARLHTVQPEIDFALAREEYASLLMRLLENKTLPLRVTHNDTKLNNVLFDKDTRKAICVIDLDTVMPGLVVNDFGDAIRFGASTAPEDETDLNKVWLSLEMFEAFAKGYLENADLTEAELTYLCDGAKMMTLECGVRFLTDYLNGDVYFKVKKPCHNLDRARTQFKLVEDMERKWDKINRIISQKKL